MQEHTGVAVLCIYSVQSKKNLADKSHSRGTKSPGKISKPRKQETKGQNTRFPSDTDKQTDWNPDRIVKPVFGLVHPPQ